MPVANFFIKEPKFNSLVKCLSSLGIGLSVIDQKMRVVWLNQVLQTAFGPANEIYRKYCYQVFSHRRSTCPNCPVLRTFRTGKPARRATHRYFNKNGRVKFCQLATAPIKHSGRIVEALELVYDVTKDRRLEEEIRRKSQEVKTVLKELSTVYSVSREVISTLDLQEVFGLVAKTVCSIIHTQACVLRMVDEDTKQLSIVSSHGVSTQIMTEEKPLKIGEGLAGVIARAARPVICPQLSKRGGLKYCFGKNRQGYQSALGVPITFKGEVLGTILAYDKSVRNYTKTEAMLLSTFASQVAIAIKNAQLYEKVHLNYLNTISALALAMEARDPYTHGHSLRVTSYAIEIAKALGLAKRQIRVILHAGKLHDVGKIAVPDTILMKPGPLTKKERQIIQLHPLKGVEMLAPLKFLESGFPLIKYHHERFDGGGYPDRLKREEIPLIARIFSCADAFDAMTSSRPYRDKMTEQKAIGELKKHAGTQFDPYIAKRFVSLLRDKPENFSTPELLFKQVSA